MIRAQTMAAVLMLTPLAAFAQDSDRLRLANKVIEVQGDMTEQVARSFNVPLPASIPAEQQARFRKLLSDELLAHKADIQALTPQVAALWAKTFSAEELQQMVDYYGSPLGQAVVAKLLSSGLTLTFQGPQNLTPEEAAARQAFLDSAAGRALQAHTADLAIGQVKIIEPLMMTMADELKTKRCVINDTCPKAP